LLAQFIRAASLNRSGNTVESCRLRLIHGRRGRADTDMLDVESVRCGLQMMTKVLNL